MAGDVAVHICTRGNEDIVTDRNSSDDDCINADPHAVSQNGCALSLATVLLAYGHALMQVAVRADDGGFVNRDVEGVPEIEPRANLSSASNLKAISLPQTVKQQAPDGVARTLRLAEDDEEPERMVGQERSACSVTEPIKAPPPRILAFTTRSSSSAKIELVSYSAES